MHGDMNHTAQNGKYLIKRLKPFLELDVFVPEGVGKEVQAYAVCASFKQSVMKLVSLETQKRSGTKKRCKGE